MASGRRHRWRTRWGVILLAAVVVVLVARLQLAGDSDDDDYQPPESVVRAWKLGREGKHKEAFPIMLEHAKKGDRFAQFSVASMLNLGNGVERDLDRALEWYRKAAEQGDAAAQFALGKIYLENEQHRDVERGITWLRRSAEQDDYRGLAQLAWAYEQGVGVDKDLDRAIGLYERSAKQGYITAIEKLGYATRASDGVFNSNLDAYIWFRIWEQLTGDEAASEERRALEADMGWWDVRRGRLRARWWVFWYGDEIERIKDAQRAQRRSTDG